VRGRSTVSFTPLWFGGVVGALVSILPAPVSAQSAGRPPELLRLGPIGFTPRLVFSGGYDSNVLNNASGEREDVVMDLRPSLDVAVGANRVRLTTSTSGTLAYFRDYPGQGGMGVNHSAQLELLGNRVRPFVAGTYQNSNERFSLEIDERARRTEYAGRAGLDLRVASKGSVSAVVERAGFSFANVTDNQGRPLNLNLNRTTDRVAATVGYLHSPFTTVGVTAEARRDQFAAVFRPEARSFRVLPSLEFRTSGLLTGRVEVGMLRFEPQVAGVPPFTGPVATVGLTYVLRDRTRFAVRIGRDLAYSADAPLAYFLQNGVNGSIGRAFGERLELRGTWELQELDFRSRVPGEPVDAIGLGRLRVTTTRGQLEFRIRRDLRVSLVGEFSRRTGNTAARGFEKVRAFTALTYGL
jgi:hypothetical protein